MNRKPKARSNPKPQTKLTKAQSLARAEKSLEQFQAIQDEKLKALNRTLTTIWNNQVELSNSADRLDEQFCVLGRLCIKTLNDILVRIGSDDLITEKVIEDVFKEWPVFKARPDRKQFMLEWFLGKPLSELPPLPEVKKETPESPDPKIGGPTEFGGDYGTRKTGDERDPAAPKEREQNNVDGKEDALPQGQDVDGPAS